MRKACHKGKRAHSTVNHFIGQNEFIIDIFFLFYHSISEGLPGVLGNKGTSPFTFREQGIFQNNF